MLEDEADAALAHGDVGRVLIAEQDAAAIGVFEAGDHAQDGRLARARRSEKRDQFAADNLERDAADGAEGVEGLFDLVEDDLHRTGSTAGTAGVTRLGRAARPAPRRSSQTFARMVTTASSARMEAAANAPTVL